MPILKKTKWWNTYDLFLLFNFYRTHQHLIPTILLLGHSFTVPLWFSFKYVTIPDWINSQIQLHTISPIKFTICTLRITGGSPWTSLSQKSFSHSPFEFNMFSITSTNLAGKYSEKDGSKILIFHLVKTYLRPMLCHLLQKFSKIKNIYD